MPTYNTRDDQCPKCHGKKILGPRMVRDGEIWCNCYTCGAEWQTNKKKLAGRKFGTGVTP